MPICQKGYRVYNRVIKSWTQPAISGKQSESQSRLMLTFYTIVLERDSCPPAFATGLLQVIGDDKPIKLPRDYTVSQP